MRRLAIAGLGACWAWVLTHLGTGVGGDTAAYVAQAGDVTAPTRYPPGMGFLLTPFAGSMTAMRTVMVVVTLGLIAAIWVAARDIGGHRAALIASVLMLLSPALLEDGDTIMSDRPAALLVVCAFLAVRHQRTALAGALAGVAAVIRLPVGVVCAALPRRSWVAAGAVLASLAGWQITVQGSLVGYDSGAASWSLDYILHPIQLEVAGREPVVSNLAYWPAVLTGAGGWIAPLAVIPAAVSMWQRRYTATGRFAGLTVLASLATVLPYFAQSTRLLLPACCLLTAHAADSLVAVTQRRAEPAGPAVQPPRSDSAPVPQ